MDDSPTNTPAITVLMPIYNAEPFLRQSLSSVQGQTFPDFEVLCLNDGSTDASREIIREFAENDPRFRLIDKPNSGYGATMNRGIGEARGEYIAILEPDDFYAPDALSVLYRAATENGPHADMAKAAFWFHWAETGTDKEIRLIGEEVAGKTVTPSDYPQVFTMMPSIWSGIYRTGFLRESGIRLLETPGASFQDLGFTFKVLACAEHAAFTDTPVLHYRQDNAASSVNDPQKAYCVFGELAEIDRACNALTAKRTAESDNSSSHAGASDAAAGKKTAKDTAAAWAQRMRGIVFRMKYDTLVWNLARLPRDTRNDFFYAALGELQDGVDDGSCDTRLFAPYQQANLRFMLAEPERFLKLFPAQPNPLQKMAYYMRVAGIKNALEAAGMSPARLRGKKAARKVAE